jgi:hypothetical protein
MPTNRPGYYWEHKEKCLENTRRYAENNREKIRIKQREYYHNVLKHRRHIDRMWANADKPPKIKKESAIKTTKTFFGPPIELSTISVEIPKPFSGVTVKPGVIIDWSL